MAEKATIDGELCVKEILKERGIKMKELAEQIDIAPETLTRTLKGNPQYSTLKSIADVLGVSVRELFKGDDKTTSKEIHGCLFVDNHPFTFKTRKELEDFLKRELSNTQSKSL